MAMLSQNKCSAIILPPSQWAIVAIESLNFLLVGGIVLPSGVFICLENVPSISPTTQVQSPLPKLTGCLVILVSGAKENKGVSISICSGFKPVVILPSG